MFNKRTAFKFCCIYIRYALGLINPFIFRLKVLFQIVFIEKFGWNDKLNEECLKEWRLISNDVKQAKDIEIHRWYGGFKGSVEVELHGFAGASVSGYGCCIYIRYCYNNYSYAHPSFFHNLELHQLNHKLFPV